VSCTELSLLGSTGSPQWSRARAEWLKQIDRMVFDDTNPVQLPPDIELSVEDAERIWPGS
jgi:hypothetical protein